MKLTKTYVDYRVSRDGLDGKPQMHGPVKMAAQLSMRWRVVLTVYCRDDETGLEYEDTDTLVMKDRAPLSSVLPALAHQIDELLNENKGKVYDSGWIARPY